MFRCEKSGRVTKPGEKMKKIVVETRERVYLDEDGVEIGRGKEIVKEISVSPATYTMWLEENPDQRPVFKKKEQPVTSAYSFPTRSYAPPAMYVPEPEPSALAAHLDAVKAGKLVPIEKNGTIVYVSPTEALKHTKAV